MKRLKGRSFDGAFYSSIGLAVVCLSAAVPGLAADKNGVSPQVISLPSGPGSIQGLGESFQPQLNSGSGSYAVPLRLPGGPAGFAPGLSLQYHTGSPNGCLGLGWKLSGPTMISRNMDDGLPLYVDSANGIDDDFDGAVDNPEEIDRFSGVDLEELVPLVDASFRSESEESFVRYERIGPGWQARSKGGVLHEFGSVPAARIENGTRVFAWLLERSTDLNNNAIEYRYMSHPDSPGQKYLQEIRWAQSVGALSSTGPEDSEARGETAGFPTVFYAAVMAYAPDRPDKYSDFRSGFEVHTGLRLSRIDVIAQGVPPSPGALVGDLNGDGQSDSLIRRYELAYHPAALQSLLTQVTLLGSDGVTALPSLTFEYTTWTPPDNVTNFMVLSSGDPIAALDSDNVELIDMNQDGLPDLLQATSTAHRVHLNLGMNALGRLAWDTVGTIVGNSPSLNLGSTAVHLADHSADGASDLIHKVNASTIQCFINTGQQTWLAPVNLGNTDSWPLWPFENLGSRTLDTDHNRMHDILFTSDNSYALWMLLPGGRYGREVPLPVLSDGTQAFTFDDPGARIADVNGDRISDLAWVQSTRVVYWASCGRGNFEGPIFLPLAGSLTPDEISRTDFADVNGDALADMVVVRPLASPNGIHYRLNRGLTGFDTLRTILGLPAVQVGDAVRCADMNGNGSVDLLISNSARPAGTREQFLDFVPGVRPGLLSRIDNGLGLVTTLEHEPSVDQMVRARTAGQPWASTMPISVPVVARMSQDDSRGTVAVREYTYRDPYYEPQKQEFRGFGYAEARDVGDDSAPTRITAHQFDRGQSVECLKGKQLVQEVLTEDRTVFLREENFWTFRELAQSPDGKTVCFPFAEAVDRYLFEGTPAAARLGTRMDYDDFGNLVREEKLGVLDAGGDEVIIEREFLYRPEIWLMDRATRERTYDGDEVLQSDEMFTYDDFGRMIEHRRWLNTEDRFILSAQNEYDDFGNLILGTNANGNSRSTVFDSLVHAYPTVETVHLTGGDLVMTATYDLGYGTVTGVTDFSGAQSSFEYDALARLTVIHKAGGARTEYAYHLGDPISRVATRMLEINGGGTHDSFDYVDGYGRPLGSKVEAAGGRWRFLDATTYNHRALPEKTWLPYYTMTSDFESPNDAESHSTLTYDVTDRIIKTVNPDATFTRTVFEPLLEHVYDETDNAGADTPTTRRMDGLHRVLEVIERNGNELYSTQYTWDTLGNLTSMTDAAGNKRLYAYDSLKRKLMTNDPDRGIMTYAYDDVGNVVETVDARGQIIRYAYDQANRIINEDYVETAAGGPDPQDVVYHYDAPSMNVDLGDGATATATFTLGRLASVTDLSGEEHRSYDARGNIQWTVKRIRDPRLDVLSSYTTRFEHDLMNRVIGIIYPDNDRLRLVYNEGAFLERLDGGPSGSVIVGAADHDPTGQLGEVQFGNGVATNYTYDSRDRLATLITVPSGATPLIDYQYSYDGVSNVTQILDRRPTAEISDASPRRNTQSLVYDDLYRLREMHFGSQSAQTDGVLEFEFDAIGNLTRQSASGGINDALPADPMVNHGVRAFGGAAGSTGRIGRNPGDPPGPHALTSMATGATFDYDENGNLLTMDGAKLTWDAKNRLTEFRKGKLTVRYTYDYADKRATKATTDGDRHDETIYAGQYFELRPGDAPAKYVFSGPTRVAQVKGTIDPTRPRVQRFRLAADWNLVTLAVETTQTASQMFGADATVYRWTGTDYVLVDPGQTIPAGDAIWVQVPSARVASALGTYDAVGDPIALPQDLSLEGWSRLELLRPAVHGAENASATYFDAAAGRWVRLDPQLPPGVGDPVSSVPAASGIWFDSPSATNIHPSNSADDDVLTYHADHLGSVSVVTDVQGDLTSETAFYSFGHVRNVHQADPDQIRANYSFADKEREGETGLQDFGARYYAPHLAVFTRPDPLFTEFTDLAQGDESDQESYRRFLTQPQMSNVYAYASGNPMKFVDLDGREIEVSDVLRKQVPLFKEALKLVAATDEGKRLLKSLSSKDFKIYMRASLPGVKDAKAGQGTSALGQVFRWDVAGEKGNLKANEYAALLNIKAHWGLGHVRTREDFVYELADTIFHELRHAEAEVLGHSAMIKAVESAFGVKYDPYAYVHDPLDRPGVAGRTDPSLDKFQSELAELRKIEME